MNCNTAFLRTVELFSFNIGRRVFLHSLYTSLKVVLNLADLGVLGLAEIELFFLHSSSKCAVF